MVDKDFSKIDISKTNGVLIDLDDTLYSYQHANQLALESCYLQFQDLFPDLIQKISQDQFMKSYRRFREEVTNRLAPHGSCRSRLLAFQALFENLPLPQAYNLALKFESFYWNHLILSAKPFPSAVAFLKRCHEQKLQVCIVTDMTAQQQIQKIQHLKIDPYVDFLVTSEEVGFEKPNPALFVAALKKLKLTAEQVIMIGDNPEKDLAGANKLGILTYLI